MSTAAHTRLHDALFMAVVVLGALLTTSRAEAGETWTLGNGLTVQFDARAGQDLLQVDVEYVVGAAQDPVGKEGLAHLTEHLMFTSSPGLADSNVTRALTLATTARNASTATFRTTYTSHCPRAMLAELLRIEASRMRSIAPTAEEFFRERSIVQQEGGYRENRSAADHLYDEMMLAAFEGHRLGRRTTTESVGAIELEDVARFHRRYMGPNRAIVHVIGDVDSAQLHTLVEAAFGGLPPIDAIDDEETLPPPHRAGCRVDDADAIDMHIGRVWQLPYEKATDIVHARLFAEFLRSSDQGTVTTRTVGDAILISRMTWWNYFRAPELGFTELQPDRDAQWARQETRKTLESFRRSLGRDQEKYEALIQRTRREVQRRLDSPTTRIGANRDRLGAADESALAQRIQQALMGLEKTPVLAYLRERIDDADTVRGVLHGRNSGRQTPLRVSGVLGADLGVHTKAPLAGVSASALDSVLQVYGEQANPQLQWTMADNGSGLVELVIPAAERTHVATLQRFSPLDEEQANKRPGLSNWYTHLLNAGYREKVSANGARRTPRPLPYSMRCLVRATSSGWRARADSSEATRMVDALERRWKSDSFNLSRWRKLVENGVSYLEDAASDPEEAADQYLTFEVLDGPNALVHSPEELRRGVDKLEYRDAEKLHEKLRELGRRTVVVTGAHLPAEARERVVRWLDDSDDEAPETPGLTGPTGVVGRIFPAFAQSDVDLVAAWPTFVPRERGLDWASMTVMRWALQRALDDELRHRRGLVYYARPSLQWFGNSLALRVRTQTLPSHAPEVFRTLGEVIDRVVRDGFEESELEVGRLMAVQQVRQQLSDPADALTLIADLARYDEPIDDPIGALLAVDPTESARWIAGWLSVERFAFALTGPLLEDELERFLGAGR